MTNRVGKNVIIEGRSRNFASERDCSLIGREKFGKQIKQSGFTCAAFADDSNFIAAFYNQAEIIKNFFARIAEREIIYCDGVIRS